MTLPDHLARTLTDAGLDPGYVEDLVRAAVEEDLAGGADVTTEATIPADQHAVGDVVTRADGVIAGLAVADAAFASAAHVPLEITRQVSDGDAVDAGARLMTITGPTRALLLTERTALNLLSRLSGIATVTRRWVDALDGAGAVVRDTRKTTPLLRPLEKYAVRCGGGANHRLSLSESALIKDNHVRAAGGISAAFKAVTAAFPGVPVEIEVDSVEGAIEAAEAGAELILLDNFGRDDVARAVQAVAGRAKLEVSGGLTLQNARAVAETGVNFLAVGALTHSAPALDIVFDLREVH